MPEQIILTPYAGSSSLKFALFTVSSQSKRLWSGAIDRIGLPGANFQLSDVRRTFMLEEPGHIDSHDKALTRLRKAIASLPGSMVLVAVGHRIGLGAPERDRLKDVTPALSARLRRLTYLAPLHMPPNLAGVDVLQASRPDLPQVPCCDTSFHHDLPRLARMALLAMPALMRDRSRARERLPLLDEASLAASPQPEHACCASRSTAAFVEASK
ncbi:hypothetical protein [Sulfitobacter sp. MF3-043]|uniref:hypothetical protein n=1 Tax=Sulfitobacter sediminivivens TaxID=3252902 RepID=UPI0036DBE211